LKAKCKAEAAPVVSTPHELKWMQKMNTDANSSRRLYPVRVLPSDNCNYNQDSGGDSSDEDYETTVEILSMESKGRQQRQISTKRLLPYHNNEFGSDLDWHDICRSTWSEVLINHYIAQENLNKKKDQIKSFLHNVLSAAKERAGYVEDDDGEQNELEENELEEPYTQAIHMNSDESYNSDDDIRKVLDHGKKYVAKERILPGDVIEYYCPVFVYGSKQGLRHATVMSVDPKRKFILELSNGELLDRDQKVKRIKVLSKFQGENVLLDHPGVTRAIEKFKLLKLNKPHDLHIETESTRLKRAIKGTIDTFMDNVKDCDFAPTDMLVRFKGIEGISGDSHDSSRKKIGEMKEILSQTDSDECFTEMKSLKKPGSDMRIENVIDVNDSSEESDDDIMISLRNQMREKSQSSSSSSKISFNTEDNDETQGKRNRKKIFSLEDSDDESDLQLQSKEKRGTSASECDVKAKNSLLNVKKTSRQTSSGKENCVNLNSSSDESDVEKYIFKDHDKSIRKSSKCSLSSFSKMQTKLNQKRSSSIPEGDFDSSDSLGFHSDDSLQSSDKSTFREVSDKKGTTLSTQKDRASSKPLSITPNSKEDASPSQIIFGIPGSTCEKRYRKPKLGQEKLSPKAKPDLPFYVKKFNNH
jgi:hypothetical protein